MSNDQSVSPDAASLLNEDLTGTDTSYPVLQAGVYDFVISDLKLEATKKGNGSMLNIKLKTVIPATTSTGVVKAPGFVVSDGIFIPDPAKTEKPETVQMAKQRIAQLKEAVTGDKAGAFGNPAQYIGRPVTARLKVEADEQFGDRNRVVAFVRRTA